LLVTLATMLYLRLVSVLPYRVHQVSLFISFFSFFFQCSPAPRDLHSFPTRRSSDLRPPATTGGRRTSTTRRRPRWKSWSPRSPTDRKSTRLNSSHLGISYAVFCLKKKTHQ